MLAQTVWKGSTFLKKLANRLDGKGGQVEAFLVNVTVNYYCRLMIIAIVIVIQPKRVLAPLLWEIP